MTKYREIKGTLIQNVSADPPASFEGQVWYNTTSNALKIDNGTEVISWVSLNALNTGRGDGGGVGTSTAALAFTGQDPSISPPQSVTNTETYNGTNWTEVNDVNTGRLQCGEA